MPNRAKNMRIRFTWDQTTIFVGSTRASRVMAAATAIVAIMAGSSTAARAQLVLDGHTATLTAKADDLPCPGTDAALDDMLKAMTNNDRYGVAEAVASSGGFLQKAGWRVRAIGHSGFLGSKIHLRMESGAHAGDACWLPSDIAGLFKNVN